MTTMSDDSKDKVKMNTDGVVPPFHQRFNIKVGMRKAKQNFKTRLVNGIYECYPAFVAEPLDWDYHNIMQYIEVVPISRTG